MLRKMLVGAAVSLTMTVLLALGNARALLDRASIKMTGSRFMVGGSRVPSHAWSLEPRTLNQSAKVFLIGTLSTAALGAPGCWNAGKRVPAYVFSSVFLHAWYSTGVASVILALAFSRRIRHEETVLKANLGREYEVYCQEVGALVPRLGNVARK